MSSLPPGKSSSSSSLSSLTSSFTDNGSGSKREKVFGFLKSKRDEYLSNVDLSAAKQSVSEKLMRSYAEASSSISSMASNYSSRESSGNSSTGAVAGFDNFSQKQLSQAKLTVYPSYARLMENGDYQVDVKGYISLPGLATRKNRLYLGLARQIIGIKSLETNDTSLADSQSVPESSEDLISLYSSDEEDIKVMKLTAMDAKDNHPNSSVPFKDPATSFTPRIQKSSSMPSGILDDKVLKERISPFVSRPILNKQVILKVGPSAEYLKGVSKNKVLKDYLTSATIYTDNNGRFNHRVIVKYPPGMVTIDGCNTDEFVDKGDDVISTIEPAFIPPQGISVISDIDDTIKHTGITGDKRNMFRNVFVKDFREIGVKGVSKWYGAMEAACAKVNDPREKVHFHYVSNSPWQLFTPIMGFIEYEKFPTGTFHLKTYTGFISGILEPAAGRKKANLERILRDFPERKFVLIGDSGEGDLEAYIDIVTNYPSQILAIFMRDITTSTNFNYGLEFDAETSQIDWQGLNSELSDIPKPIAMDHDDLIQLEHTELDMSNKAINSEFTSSSSTSSMATVAPPPPPPRRRGTASSSNLPPTSPDNSETETKFIESITLSDIPKKAKLVPKVPRKPVALRSSINKISSSDNTDKTMVNNGTSARPAVSSRSCSSSTDMSALNLSTSLTAPPPLPKRPSEILCASKSGSPTPSPEPGSMLTPNGNSNRFRSRTRSNSGNSTYIYNPSDYEEEQIITQMVDRKIEGWIRRLDIANKVLAAKNKDCKLIIWRDGQDNGLVERSCEIIRHGLSHHYDSSQAKVVTDGFVNGNDDSLL